MKNSVEFDAFVERLTKAAAIAATITEGLWLCTINAYWPTESHVIGHGTPNADPDAPISTVLDALQLCGVIDDDMRIESVIGRKHYDKTNPRTEIRLERIK